MCKIAYSAEQGTELVSFSKFRIQSEKRLLIFVVSHCFFLVQKLSTLPLGSKVIRELIETWQKDKEVPSTTVPFREALILCKSTGVFFIAKRKIKVLVLKCIFWN